jgi:hypothetical protein
MSRTVGKILQVGAIVASVALAPTTGGASLIGLKVSASTAAIVAAGIAVASMANAMLMPKVRQQARQASATTLQLGEAPRQAGFGTFATAGSLANAFNYGGKYGTDWEVQSIALADHECEALEGFYVNDVYVAFTGDGVVAGYNGQLEVYWRPGTEGQAVPSVLSTHGGYAASDNGAGVCHVTVCYKSDDEKAKNPIWTAGRPRFLWVLRGLKCYDARADSTVAGGSGAHRWANPATRAWSENAIVCRYNWVRGIYACNRVGDPDMLLVGRGLTAVEAPPENVAARANVCDETVALTAGGSEKRYRCGGMVRADEDYLTVEEYFASACGGVITQPQGCVEIEPGQAKSPTFFFTDADLIAGSDVRWDDFISEADDEWVNTVVPRYVEPAQRWADHAAPVRRVVADVIEDGGPREETLSLPLVTSATQAGRAGEIKRRLGRLQGRGSVTLGPRFSEIEEGDWGVWTSARRFGGAGRTVRVEAWSSGENGHMTLRLRQISASCYTDTADLSDGAVAVPQGPPPPVGAPDGGSWTLTTALLDQTTALVPGLVVTGAAEDDYARFVKVEYWPDDGVTDPAVATGWTAIGLFGPDIVRIEAPVAADTVYYAAVSYVVGDRTGDRLILGPVTTPRAVINLAGYVKQGAVIAVPAGSMGGGDILGLTNLDLIGDTVIVTTFFPAVITVTDPDQGVSYGFELELYLKDGGGTYIFSDKQGFSERWDAPDATGTKDLEFRSEPLETVFTGVGPGPWSIGYRVTTPAGNGVSLRPYRYFRFDDKGAAQ